MDPHARRVLLCLRYGIGDVVMELPALDILRAALPRARITALGAEPAIELVREHPAVDEVHALNRWGFRHRWDPGPAHAARAISAWLDEHDFDLFLDVHHVTSGFGEVVWSRGVRSLEADEAVEREVLATGGDGVAAIQAAIHAGWGLPRQPVILPRFTPPERDREHAREYLRGKGLEHARPLAISPVASLGLKQWPLDRLARIADAQIEASAEPVLALCGPQQSAGEALRRYMRHPDRLISVGPLPLLSVAAVLERCRAFVCNDTGLMHLASALGVPTVAVFGPTKPSIYRPPGEWVVSVGGENVDCPHRNTGSLHPPRCFGEGRCLIGDRGCIEETPLEDVGEALRALLERFAPRAQRRLA